MRLLETESAESGRVDLSSPATEHWPRIGNIMYFRVVDVMLRTSVSLVP